VRDFLGFLALYAGWIVLNRWILPRAGVQT
jgi:hypothetical protein